MSVFQRVFRYFQLRDADRQGDGRLVQMFGGADKSDFTRGDIAVFDASGSVIDGGPPASNSGGYGSPWQQVPVGIMNMANADFYLDFIPLTFTNLAGVEEVWMQLDVNGDGQDPYFHFHAFPGTNHFVMRFPPKASDKEMVCRYFRGIPTFTPGGQPPPPPPPAPPPPGGILGCSSGTVTTLAGGGLHPYWRITVTAVRGGIPGFGIDVGIAQLELFSTVGGPSIATGGSPFGDPGLFGADPPNAFDNDPATSWDPIATNPKIGYHFLSPVSIVSFAIGSVNTVNWFGTTPTDLTLDWSDDGSTFTSGWRFVVDPPCWTTQGQTMVFVTDSTGAPPPPPPPTPTATLDIWADYPGTVNGVPAVSYTLDGGLTWVGGDGTLPGDAGISV